MNAGIAYMRDEVMPALQATAGCVGISLLVNRQSGLCIATSAWETADAMTASEVLVRPVRRAAEMFGGTGMIEEWEIASLHRDHHSLVGACVRATWVQVAPDQMDGAIEFYKASVLPEMDDVDGFCSASLMVDRSTGRAVSSATFDSREAMERARDRAAALKNEKLREAGVDELDEREFELALAHLRVPELA